MKSSDELGVAHPPAATARRWMVALLLLLGVEFWLVFAPELTAPRYQGQALGITLLIAALPPIRRRISKSLNAIRFPLIRQQFIVAAALALCASVYFPVTAFHQSRSFGLRWQDELSYAVQIRMLASGRLWMPRHPLGDFFDSFQVIVDPVYASMYFPGASLFYVPAAWVGAPYWIVSSLISGCCVGLIYLIFTELFDGVAGAIAAIMLVGLSKFRELSIMTVGHPAIVLLTLLVIYSWLRWRATRSPRWVIAMGAFMGWSAITRPLDGLVIAIPIFIDLATQMRRESSQKLVRSSALLLASTMPFLILQIIFNLGVTGSWRRTPFELYANRDYPGTGLGFHAPDKSLRPLSPLPQKQKFHDVWTIDAIERHQPGKLFENWYREDLRTTLANSLPHPWMTFLLPLALLGLPRERTNVLLLMFPVWIGFFSLYTWLLPHYALILVASTVAMVMVAVTEIRHTWPRWTEPLGTLLSVALVTLSLLQMFEVNRHVKDQYFVASELPIVDSKLAQLEHRPAVVLFHFPPDANPHVEPVYNIDVAWPDDARVIRAHDLGPARNQAIFDYYAKQSPDRAFYRFDRGDRSIRFLGFARDLGHAH